MSVIIHGMNKPTEQQQKVIETVSGVVLVQACPGSGKTQTLVDRTIALSSNDRKLVLAFNKKAAEEFASRLNKHGGANADVRTFHSFCLGQIKKNYKAFGFAGMPEVETSIPLFKALLAANDEPWQSWDESPWDEDFIKMAEHTLYDADLAKIAKGPEKIKSLSGQEGPNPVVLSAKALLKLRQWLVANNKLTFDSMIRLVAENTNRISWYGQHIMIDEYQDVDRFQFDISVAMTKMPGIKSFVVVGDPNQRIYEWRGALGDAFGDMSQAFPASVTLPLTVNFRSKDEILALAETICPVGMTGVKGSDPKAVVKLAPESGEDKHIVEGANGDLHERAILCRFNRDCMSWGLRLAKKGIPVMVLGKGDFWSTKHIKMAKEAWLKGQRDSSTLFTSKGWTNMLRLSRYQDEEMVNQAMADAAWIMSLSREDMKVIEQSLQNEMGIRVSTIHKVKGSEYNEVLIHNCDAKLKADKFVYYVAATRARNRLVLA